METEKQRLDWIDSLKGFAIICVVIGHVVKGLIDDHMFIDCSTWMNNTYNIIYSFHMPLFFVISGFLFNLAYIKKTSNNTQIKTASYKRQLINLIILYIVYSILLGVSKMALPGAVNKQVSFKDILMIWAIPIQLYWYLYVLIILYLIFSISFFRNCHHYTLILTGLFLVSVFSWKYPFPNWFQLKRVCYYSFFFYFGNKLNDIIKLTITRAIGVLISLSAIILAFVVWNKNMYIVDIPVVNASVALGFVCILLFSFSKVSFLKQNILLKACGRYNLEIYLLHTYFATAIRVLYKKTGVTNGTVAVCLSSIASVLFSILCSYLAKKLNLYDIFFKPYYFICNNQSKK